MNLTQNHITVAFPIKSPADAKAIAGELPSLMPDFAKAQDVIGSVHYSRFLPQDDATLIFLADIDGKPEKLSGDLAKSVGPVFDVIFKHVVDPPPTPVTSNSDTFIKWVKQHSSDPLIVYSAFENASVQDIKAAARAAGFNGSGEQHPLLISLPMKSKLRAFVFEEIILKAAKKKMDEGADSVGTLHFAHFVTLADTHLGFFTIFDGTFEKYIGDFTEKLGPVFDLMFKYVSDPPPTPVSKNAKAFLDYSGAMDRPGIGYYSAYPGMTVQDVRALLADAKAGAA
ncbi:MAG: hypothetical protein WA419_03560 [Silvibacterium sp.]